MAADLWTFSTVLPGDDMTDIVPPMVRAQRDQGGTFFRATLVNCHSEPLADGEEAAGVYLEGWRQRPDEQGPFDPRLMGRSLEITP